MEPGTQMVLGTLCLSCSPQMNFIISEKLSPQVGSRAASYPGLTSSQFCGQKDSISSPNLPGKHSDWPAEVKCWMTNNSSLPGTE